MMYFSFRSRGLAPPVLLDARLFPYAPLCAFRHFFCAVIVKRKIFSVRTDHHFTVSRAGSHYLASVRDQKLEKLIVTAHPSFSR